MFSYGWTTYLRHAYVFLWLDNLFTPCLCFLMAGQLIYAMLMFSYGWTTYLRHALNVFLWLDNLFTPCLCFLMAGQLIYAMLMLSSKNAFDQFLILYYQSTAYLGTPSSFPRHHSNNAYLNKITPIVSARLPKEGVFPKVDNWGKEFTSSLNTLCDFNWPPINVFDTTFIDCSDTVSVVIQCYSLSLSRSTL